MIKEVDENWDLEIKPQNHLFELHLVDVWRYRDLLLLFVISVVFLKKNLNY